MISQEGYGMEAGAISHYFIFRHFLIKINGAT